MNAKLKHLELAIDRALAVLVPDTSQDSLAYITIDFKKYIVYQRSAKKTTVSNVVVSISGTQTKLAPENIIRVILASNEERTLFALYVCYSLYGKYGCIKYTPKENIKLMKIYPDAKHTEPQDTDYAFFCADIIRSSGTEETDRFYDRIPEFQEVRSLALNDTEATIEITSYNHTSYQYAFKFNIE